MAASGCIFPPEEKKQAGWSLESENHVVAS